MPADRPRNPRKKNAASAPSGTVRAGGIRVWLSSRYARFFYAIAVGSFAVYTLIALVSYLFTWADDQSLLAAPDLMDPGLDAGNSGGKFGFLWAELLVSRLFGLGALLIPLFLGGVSLVLFRIRTLSLTRLFFVSLYGCIVLSLVVSFLFSFFPSVVWFGFGAGGAYGYAVNAWLCAALGRLGTGLLLLTALLFWLLWLNRKIVDRMMAWIDRAAAAGSGRKTAEDPESAAPDGSGPLADPEEDGEKHTGIDAEEEEEEGEAGEADGEEGAEDEAETDDPAGEPEIPEMPLPAGREPDSPSSGEPRFEVIGETGPDCAPEAAAGAETDGPAGQPADEPEETLPPVEVIPGDDGDYSRALTDDQWKERYDPRLSLSNFRSPGTDLLEEYRDQIARVSKEELEMNNRKIVTTLKNYRIEISKISARIGPTVTLYEIVPAPGVRVSQIKRLEEDIALSLAARGVRVVTLVGTNAIGIEVANEKPSIVSMRSVLEDPRFRTARYDLPVVLGRTISNEAMAFDLAKMPHLLVAGATGQGKSVGLNAIITSLLYRKHPSELKFVLVDPKKVELSLYEPLEKHYLAKLPDAEEAIITDTQKVIYTLKSLCKLMDHRYDLLKAASVRNVREYNEKFLSRRLNPYKGHEYMPYIVVVIDEFADLLMTAGREIEEPIARLAQLARAIGIHLVIATQRPTTNIITGTIKANFPARIAFRVISSVDSKTILDQTGANQLIGRGDMLISTGSDLTRVQCAFIDTPEVERVTRFISAQAGFGGAYLLPEYVPEDGGGGLPMKVEGQGYDVLLKDAARLIVREQQGSTSLIQRKMNLGYNRAGRIMDQLEELGIVGPSEGSKARQVRVTSLESLELILSGIN